MKEEFSFYGFSKNIEAFAEVERFWDTFFNNILRKKQCGNSWRVSMDMPNIKTRFEASDGVVYVGCFNDKAKKAVRIQHQDPFYFGKPASREKGRFTSLKPAYLFVAVSAFEDSTESNFHYQNLIVTCEMSKRIEKKITPLIEGYIFGSNASSELEKTINALCKEEVEYRDSYLE